MQGSGALTRWLLDHDLVDEINPLIVPVVVESRHAAVPCQRPDVALGLVDLRAFPKGATIQVYRPTERPQYPTARTGLSAS